MAKAEDYKIALDDGHGPQTAGKRTPYIASLGRQIRENEFNKPVVNYLEAELRRCGFRTIQLAPTDLDTPLRTRTNTANAAKADILVSVHFNAMGNTFAYSSAKGFSAHIQEGMSNSSNAYRLAKLMIEELSKGTPQVNRGVVKQNLHMTRESAMPAVLVECGFMDDPGEALLMISTSFHKEVARESAMAICRYFGVAYVPEKPEAITAAKPEPDPIPKEDDKLYKPEVDEMTLATSRVLMRLADKGEKSIGKEWRDKLNSGELTESQAIGLIYTAIDRGLIVGYEDNTDLVERVEKLEKSLTKK